MFSHAGCSHFEVLRVNTACSCGKDVFAMLADVLVAAAILPVDLSSLLRILYLPPAFFR